MRREVRRRRMTAEDLETKKGSNPQGDMRQTVEVHITGRRKEKDEKGHICVDAASHERPMLHEVTCQSGDCWEQGQGQHHRKQVLRQLQSEKNETGEQRVRGKTWAEWELHLTKGQVENGRIQPPTKLKENKLVLFRISVLSDSKRQEMHCDCRMCFVSHQHICQPTTVTTRCSSQCLFCFHTLCIS